MKKITEHETTKATYIPAPHRLRVAAWVMDSLIIMVIILCLPQPIRLIVPLLFLIFYHTFQIWLVQQTVGKALFGLKVERIGKEPGTFEKKPGLFWALARSSLGYFMIDLLGLASFSAFIDHDHRCPHDRVFGSLVVYEQEPGSIEARNLLEKLKRKLELRLEKFTSRYRSAMKDWEKWVLAILISLLKRLIKWATDLQKGVDFLAGELEPRPSVFKALSQRAILAISAATTVAGVTVFASTPIARAAKEWLMTPRYLVASPPTNTPTPTNTTIPTITPTFTPEATPTPTFTLSPTISPTPSASSTPTISPTPTPTRTPTPTLTPTLTFTSTSTPTPVPTPTLKPTPTQKPTKPSAPTTAPDRCGAICNDGTKSSSTGSGACSHHDGVREWLYPPDC